MGDRMKKTFILCVILFLSACEKPSTTPVVPELKPAPSPVPHALIKVRFKPINATDTEKTIITQAEKIIADTMQSTCLKNFMSNEKLVQTNDKTPALVYEHLLSLQGEIKLHLYSRCMSFSWRCVTPTSAVAYRDPPETDIYLNRVYFHTDLSAVEWAATMAHEALGHALGNYTHDFNATARRPYSVPYKLGEGIEKCATRTR